MEQRLTMVSLGVNDVADSTAFYGRLGWQKSETTSNETITFIQLGSILLGLYGRGPLAEDIGIENTAPEGFSGITLAHNTRTKEEVDDVLALAVEAGAKLLKPGQDVFWGGYSGYFADPDGHIWEVAWNPFMEISEDGAVVLPD
jgi:uncharacterized protein